MKKFFIFSVLCLIMAFGIGTAWAQDPDCTITTLPFTEGFESGSLGPCYHTNTQALMPNGQYYPQVATGGTYAPSHSGTYHLMSYNFLFGDTAAQVPCLIFPELSSTFDIQSIVMDFWGWVNSAAGYFVVGVMDDPTDMSTFTAVQTIIPTNTNSTYEHYTAYFTNYTGTGHYIAIKLAVTAYCMIRVDDFTIDQAAMCSPVQNLSLQSIVGSDVTINWQPNALGTPASYNISLYDMTDTLQVVYTSTADTFYTFYNLDYSTDYRAYVSVVCTDNQESSADSVDFSTLAPSAELPYFEDFEGDSTVLLAPFTFSGTGANQWVYGTAAALPGADAQPGDPSHAIYVSPDSGATNIYANIISDAYAVLNVTFPTEAVEYHLAFDYRVVGEASDYSEFDYMKVYMMSAEATVPATGAPSGTALLYHLGEVANVSDWTHFDVILDNVAGTSKQIVFYWYNNGWNLYGDNHLAAAVDNISITGISCAQPNNLAATAITSDGATLSWNEVGSATAWTLYYRAAGSTDPYTEIQTTDTFHVLVGLTSNTDYEFYVVSDCGDGLSNPSVTATFRTDCGTISQLPYTENFESGLYSTTQNTYIACWDRLTTDNSHYAYVGTASYYAHGGEHYMDFHYTPNCHVIAIMPELDASISASDLMVSFFACHTNYGYATLGTLEVGVMTDKTDTASFVVVDTIDLSGHDSYTYFEQLVSLASYSGTGKYIAFRVSNCDNCGYYIDDLVLEERPDCMYPDNFSLVTLGNDYVTLTWTELGDATAWNIQYDTTGFTAGQGANTVPATSTTFTVNNLTNLTAYDFYVQADCGGSQSDWIGPISVITGVLNMGITGSDTMTTCDAIICDDGGNTGDYSSYCDYTVVINPATQGGGLQITGTADLHPGAYSFGESHLYFYEGVGTNGALIAEFTGMGNSIQLASSGSITVRFTSSYYTAGGFVLNVSCATCTPPSGVTLTDLTNDAATLSWTGGADQYAIYLTGDTTGYFTTSGSSFALAGLSANSTYHVQLRSICGTDSSLLSPVFTFTTPCDAITITETTPWTEDFESYVGSGNTPFQCWARPVVDATYNAPFVYCGYAPACHSGVNSAELKGANEMLVLPLFSNDVHDLRLSFWATSTSPGTGTLEIGVLPNVLDPSSFELVDVAGVPGPRGSDSTGNGNFMGPFDFGNVVAPNGRIALRYNNLSSFESWNLDDFVVEISSGCSAPTDVTVSAVTTSEATVTWASTASEWKLQYKAAASSDWGTEYTVTALTYNLVNLIPNTGYQVRVKSVCDATTESVWSPAVSFTTESAVVITEPTVETYPASDITQTTVTLNGAITDPGNQGIIARGIEWKLNTDNDYTQAPLNMGNTLVFTLTGLAPNTCGTFRAYATTANTTTYGETLSFCTLPGDTPEPCDVPTGLYVNADSMGEYSYTALIRWDDNPDVSQWNLQYKAAYEDWTTITVSENSYLLENLEYYTTYYFRVQAICGDNNTSDWSDIEDYWTFLIGIDSWLENRVSLYPNPAKEYVDIRIDGDVNVTMMEVYDVYGKLVNTVNVVDNPTRINVSALADGMYFVRVTTEEGMVTKTFVKR
jgi:hypothetical protein